MSTKKEPIDQIVANRLDSGALYPRIKMFEGNADRLLTRMNSDMHESAKQPNDLERFFVERVNAGDIEGLIALYEPSATLACDNGEVSVGLSEVRRFFVNFLASRPRLSPSIQGPALCSGDLALTSSRHSNGDISAEIARRQPDGNWLWAVDQFRLGKQT